MLESHSFWRGAFETVRNARRQQYESVRLELNGSRATNGKCANARETVVQTRRLASVGAQSPAIAYVADRKIRYSDVEHGQQMIQDDVLG